MALPSPYEGTAARELSAARTLRGVATFDETPPTALSASQGGRCRVEQYGSKPSLSQRGRRANSKTDIERTRQVVGRARQADLRRCLLGAVRCKHTGHTKLMRLRRGCR